jgi:hypothetical protein
MICGSTHAMRVFRQVFEVHLLQIAVEYRAQQRGNDGALRNANDLLVILIPDLNAVGLRTT